MARHNLAHAAAGTIELAPEVARVPAAHYVDPERFERERARIFRRLPLVLALSCELRERGAYMALTAAGIPVLLLSGDADPITPPRYASLAMVDLERARHLIGAQQGHGQAAVGCTPQLLGDFVASADPESLDATCLERSFVMPFFLDFGGPSP